MIVRLIILSILSCLPLVARTHVPPQIALEKQFDTMLEHPNKPIIQSGQLSTQHPTAIDVNKTSEATLRGNRFKSHQSKARNYQIMSPQILTTTAGEVSVKNSDPYSNEHDDTFEEIESPEDGLVSMSDVNWFEEINPNWFQNLSLR